MTRADRWPDEPLTWLIEQTAVEIVDTVGYLELTDAGRALLPTDPQRQVLVDQLAEELGEAAVHLHELADRYGIDLAPPLVPPPPAEPVVLPAPHRPGEDR